MDTTEQVAASTPHPGGSPLDNHIACTEAYLDSIDGEYVAGWAWDEARPESPVKLDIFDGDRLLATVSADEFRQDLLDAGKGDGKHGFSYTVPYSLRDGKVHTIRVKVSGTGVQLLRPGTTISDDIPTPPEGMLLTTGHPNARAFREAGQGVFDACRVSCRLRPDERVLDVGCGVGRLAIPLTRYLGGDGAYDGIDIVPELINWCKDNISTKYPNFRFQLADVYNAFYHPAGRAKASEYKFPYEDRSFHLVFLGSLFTHLVPAEMENYLSEIARVLRRGGRCMISVFLMDGGAFKHKESKPTDLDFKYKFGEYYAADKDVPEAAIAYEEDYLRGLYRKHGLTIVEPIQYGVQDVIIAAKK